MNASAISVDRSGLEPDEPFCTLLDIDLFLIDRGADLRRSAVKTILSRYLQIGLGEIEFVIGSFGKPALSPRLGARLWFNTSGTDTLLLLGVSTVGEVGVDIEDFSRFTSPQPLYRRALSSAERRWLGPCDLASDLATLTQYWCRKEAILKASGYGLKIRPESVDVYASRGTTTGRLMLATPSGTSSSTWSDIDLSGIASHLVGSVALLD